MKYSIRVDRDKNDFKIQVFDNWKGVGFNRTTEIIPPKTWFWKRNKFIKEKINEVVEELKKEIIADIKYF